MHRSLFGWAVAALARLAVVVATALAAPIRAFREAVAIAFTAEPAALRLGLPPAPAATVGYVETRAFQRRRAERVARRSFVSGAGSVGVGLAFA